MSENKAGSSLEAVVKARLDGDTAFQASLATLSDDEKNKLITTKTGEIREAVFKETSENLVKAETIAKDQKGRAEKAEREAGEKKDLSSDEIFTLTEAKINREDISVVKEYSTLNKVSIADALKSDVLQGVIKDRVAKRATAAATIVTPAAKPASTKDAHTIMDEASKGEAGVPEKGSTEAEDLYWLRRGRKNPNK